MLRPSFLLTLAFALALSTPAHAVRIVVDNFEDGPFSYGPGTHLQVNLNPLDCKWGIREVQVGPNSYASTVQGWLNRWVRIEDNSQEEQQLRYSLPVVDLSSDAGFEKLSLYIEAIDIQTVPNWPATNLSVFMWDINNRLGTHRILIEEPGWKTIPLSLIGKPFPQAPDFDIEEVTEIRIVPYQDMEIGEITLSGPADLSLLFSSGEVGGPIPSLLGTPIVTNTLRILSPHSTEPGEPMSMTVQELANESHDTVDGDIQIRDTASGDAAGVAVGFSVTESGLTPGDTRWVEVERSYAPGRSDLQLEPLQPPVITDARVAHLPIRVAYTDGIGQTWARDEFTVRVEIPAAQPWQIDGIEFEPLSPGIRLRIRMPLVKEPGVDPVEGLSLVELAWRGYQERLDPITSVSPRPREGLILVAEPSVMETSTRFQFSRELGRRGEILIFDARGRRVRELSIASNQASIRWDGRDDSAVQVGSGVYYALLRGGSQSARTKIVKLR